MKSRLDRAAGEGVYWASFGFTEPFLPFKETVLFV
jgi:hypothetical protein